jgi:thiamine-monophosphate kinase
MREFELIRRLQEIIRVPDGPHSKRCVLGIGDDAAIFDPPAGSQLVACTDSLVEGVHFPASTSPAAIGHKALAVNLSDLAAMGAEPAWFLLALTLPRAEPDWLESFARGMAGLAVESGILLAGGDVASGPLNICVTALGVVEPGRALPRSGARPGDLVVVSGRPGGAAHALQTLEAGGVPDVRDLAALEFPQPRLTLGRALRGLATACIDISDGLLADLGHILEQSGAGAELELRRLPCPGSLASLPEQQRWPLQLSGGDDYELCFTVPEPAAGQLDAVARRTRTELTVIGTITAAVGLVIREPGGGRYPVGHGGYEHFSGDADPAP